MGRGQELLDAARDGDRRTVEKILAQITKRSGPFTSLRRGAGVNVQDDNDGYTPLHHACLRGHRDIVQLLLSVDASPCIVDKKGINPLHLAAWKGDATIVRMLLAHKSPPVNVDQMTSDQETALLIAARAGFVDVVKELIMAGADVTVKNMKQETPLDLASQYGRLETVEHLLQVRPDLVRDYKHPIGRGHGFASTPLHLAAKHGHKEVVRALINAGVEPNVHTQDGTPLHEAVRFRKASVVRALLSRGADLRAKDRRGKTVYDLLDEFKGEASKRVWKEIRDFELNQSRSTCDSEDDCPPFPVQDSPSYPYPAGMTAPKTQKNTNTLDSQLLPSPSTSSITKSHSQSFVKKLASKCLGLKAKFSSASAPNVSNITGLESIDTKVKNPDHKSTSTLHIGNSKFFKILSKKEESGDIVCNDEFDTISLDRLGGTINRDSVVNRSNRSCPGFKTSLPNISENNELSDTSSVNSIEITEIHRDSNISESQPVAQALNLNIFEPRERSSVNSNISSESAHLVNECYESYEFSEASKDGMQSPKPPPRATVIMDNNNTIYENLATKNKNPKPTPAVRTHLPPKFPASKMENKIIYENVTLLNEKKLESQNLASKNVMVTDLDEDISPSSSRTSSVSSDSMSDETNLEDILLSEKSKSFRHSKQYPLYPSLDIVKSEIHRTQSNASNLSDFTQASAIENVDCIDVNEKELYLSMTGTLPSKDSERKVKKKVLFRHKTFTNIELDRNSTNVKDLPKWDSEYLKDTLANYHIRGTGHCMYKAPTVQEFIYIFNRDTLYKDVEPFTKVPNDKRDSYYETAICFCKARPPKHHNSAEDLLELTSNDNEGKVSIEFDVLKNKEITTTTFRCFCESEDCKLHDTRREAAQNVVVKFSVIKRSISTPDITLDISPCPTVQKSLPKIQSVPFFEDPYAVVNLEDILAKNRKQKENEPSSPVYTTMSPHSTMSSTARPYSIKDISEVISLNSNSSNDATHTCASVLPLRKSSSEHSGHWSLQSCYSNVTIKSDASFKSCMEDSDDGSDGVLESDDSSDTDTIKSDISTGKRPWVHSDSFRFGAKESKFEMGAIEEESKESDSKLESGISVDSSESSYSEGGDDSGVPRDDSGVPKDENGVPKDDSSVPRVDNVSLGASLERGVAGGVRSGSGRRRWDEADGTSEGDALSVSSAASSCAPLHLAHHYEHSKVSPTPPKKPPRRNLSVSPTHANSPSSGYSYELRPHARSQDDLDEIQGAKNYLKHGRSVDQYVDGKLSYSEYEENHSSPRIAPVPNPRPSLKNRPQPVAITAMYENVVIKEQNPRRKLRRNNQYENFEPRMDSRGRKYSTQERSSLESLLDDQSMNSPSDCERYDQRIIIPQSPTHYDQPPTPDHPPPSARQAENSIHQKIRPLSQLIMEVVEEIRIRKKSQGDIVNS